MKTKRKEYQIETKAQFLALLTALIKQAPSIYDSPGLSGKWGAILENKRCQKERPNFSKCYGWGPDEYASLRLGTSQVHFRLGPSSTISIWFLKEVLVTFQKKVKKAVRGIFGNRKENKGFGIILK